MRTRSDDELKIVAKELSLYFDLLDETEDDIQRMDWINFIFEFTWSNRNILRKNQLFIQTIHNKIKEYEMNLLNEFTFPPSHPSVIRFRKTLKTIKKF